jgi:hypothetical protein
MFSFGNVLSVLHLMYFFLAKTVQSDFSSWIVERFLPCSNWLCVGSEFGGDEHDYNTAQCTDKRHLLPPTLQYSTYLKMFIFLSWFKAMNYSNWMRRALCHNINLDFMKASSSYVWRVVPSFKPVFPWETAVKPHSYMSAPFFTLG